jgi:hypothetical protein
MVRIEREGRTTLTADLFAHQQHFLAPPLPAKLLDQKLHPVSLSMLVVA